MSFVFTHIYSYFNAYIKVLQWRAEGKGRSDESIPKIDQTRQLHLQGTSNPFPRNIN